MEPQFERREQRAPADGPEVHKAMKPESMFKFYSAVRCNTQEMVWRSVIPGVRREAERRGCLMLMDHMRVEARDTDRRAPESATDS